MAVRVGAAPEPDQERIAVGSEPVCEPVGPALGLDGAELDGFCLALCADAEGVEAQADACLLRLGSASAVGEALLAPAARRLGAWWEDDRIDFASVTLGAVALQRLLRRLARAVAAAEHRASARPLLLAALPGEQHGLGLQLLDQALRERGAAPLLLPAPTLPELEAAVRSGTYDLVGLSVGGDDSLQRLPATAAALRRAAPRPLHILAGGPAATALQDRPDRGGVDEVVTHDPVERLLELATGGHEPALAAG